MQTTIPLSINQIAQAIATVGHKRSVLVQGPIGCGKSSIGRILEKQFSATHNYCYFDCTNKDLGDLFVPNFKEMDGRDYVTFTPNEEFGIHFNKPVIINFDEMGKANPMVKQGITRCLLERYIGARKLPEGSIVFGTTNLGGEGVGDMFVAHQLDRQTVLDMRKPTQAEWMRWAVSNDVDHTMLAWVKDNPQLFQNYDECRPDDNPYIYHPSLQQTAFVTPRSLEAASDWLKPRESYDDETLQAALAGTIGARAAYDLMAFVKLADQIPSLEEVMTQPDRAVVPTSPAATCMVVFRTLANIDDTWVDNWIKYMRRLDTEAQGVFANCVRDPEYRSHEAVMTNRQFMLWAKDNAHLFSADKI